MRYRRLVLGVVAVALGLGGCVSPDDYFHIDYVEEDDTGKPGSSDPVRPGTSTEVDKPENGEVTVPGGSLGVEGGEDEDDPFGELTPGGVTVEEAFALTVVTPAEGRTEGGYEIKVQGKKIDRKARVFIGNVESPQTTFVTSSLVRAMVPAGQVGCVDVSVVNTDGEKISLKDAFCYTERLVISSVEPRRAVEKQLTPIVISGTGFGDKMQFYARDAEKTLPLIDVVKRGNQYEAVLPQFASGEVDILANSANSHAERLGAIELIRDLQIDEVKPFVVASGATNTVRVLGSGFEEGRVGVRVGGVAGNVTHRDMKSLTTLIPALDAGCYELVAYDELRQAKAATGLYVTDQPLDAALLAAVVPSRGSMKGQEVQLLGTALPTGETPRFGASAAKTVSENASAWVVQTPAVTSPGIVDVTIGELTLKDAYEFVQTPSITSLEPELGAADTVVTLHGSDFDETLRVFADQFESTDVTVVDSNTARVVMPSGTGVAQISVEQNGVREDTNLTFAYTEKAEIWGISPSMVSSIGGFTVDLYGRGFDGVSHVFVDDVEVIDAWFLSPGHIRFVTLEHEPGDAKVELVRNDGQIVAESSITYYQPGSLNTNVSGGKLDGRMNVTVLTVDTSELIVGADVHVGTGDGNYLNGTTNEHGQVSFEDESLVGSQILYACKTGYSCNTLQTFDAQNVTIYLEKWEWTDPPSSIDVPPPPPPPPPEDESISINPVDITFTKPAENTYFEGRVSGFGKVALESDPDVVRAAIVLQSQLSPYTSYSQDDVYTIFEEKGTYRIKARKGEVALGLVCGLFNQKTRSFDPRYFGVKTGFYVTNGQTINVDLDCPLPLNQVQRVKFLNLPAKEHVSSLYSSAYLNLGNSGYIGGFMTGHSENDYVAISHVPPLRGDLEGATLALQTDLSVDGTSYGSLYSYDIARNDTTVEIGPIVSWPVWDSLPPESVYNDGMGYNRYHNAEALLKNGTLTWHVSNPEYVDFYAVTIRGYYYMQNEYGQTYAVDNQLLWQFYLPGNATSLEFPEKDYTNEFGLLPRYIYITLTAYKTIRQGYDFNQFTTLDTKHYYVDTSVSSTLYIPWDSMQ